MPFGVSKLKRRLQTLVRVYTFQNVKLLEITCHGSFHISEAVKSATLSAENTEPEVLYNRNLNNNKFNTSQQNKDIPTQNTSHTGIQHIPEPGKKGKNVTNSIEPENYQSSGQKSSDMHEAGKNVTDSNEPVNYQSSGQKSSDMHEAGKNVTDSNEPVNYQSSGQTSSDMHEAGKNVTDSIEPVNYQSSGRKPSDMHEAGKNVTDCHTDKHTDDLVKNQFEEQASGGAGLEPLPSLVGNLSSYQDMHQNSNIETGPGFAKEKQQGLNKDPQRATEGCNVPDRETLIPRTEGKEPISDMDRDQETRPDNPKSEDVSLKLNIKGVNGNAGNS